jgi:hypothetical protein
VNVSPGKIASCGKGKGQGKPCGRGNLTSSSCPAWAPAMSSTSHSYLFAGARAAGNLVGTKIPAIVTSRADDLETRLLSIGLAVNTRC